MGRRGGDESSLKKRLPRDEQTVVKKGQCEYTRSEKAGVSAVISSCPASTIAAPCAGRAVARVIAIPAYPGSQEPRRKGSRQFQGGFKALACTPSHKPSVRTRGLRTRSFYMRHGHTQCTRCTVHGARIQVVVCPIAIQHKEQHGCGNTASGSTRLTYAAFHNRIYPKSSVLRTS